MTPSNSNAAQAYGKIMERDTFRKIKDRSMLEDEDLMKIEGIDLMSKEDACRRNDLEAIPHKQIDLL